MPHATNLGLPRIKVGLLLSSTFSTAILRKRFDEAMWVHRLRAYYRLYINAITQIEPLKIHPQWSSSLSYEDENRALFCSQQQTLHLTFFFKASILLENTCSRHLSKTCTRSRPIPAFNTNKVGLHSSGFAVNRVGSSLDDGPFHLLD